MLHVYHKILSLLTARQAAAQTYDSMFFRDPDPQKSHRVPNACSPAKQL